MKFLNEIINAIRSLKQENIVDICIGILIFALFILLSSILSYIIVKIFNFKIKDPKKIKANGFYKPLRTFFSTLGIYIGSMVLDMPQEMFQVVTKIFKIAIIFLASKGFANLFDFNSDGFNKIRKKFHINSSDTAINLFSKIIKFFIYIVGIFIILKELGYDLSGLVTGLGITSVVIALAAQDAAKSILSGATIMSDKPFDIGDYIEIDKYSGTVEDITFRTTRIRDINNQIVVLPNSLLTATPITNMTKREKRRYNLSLTLELNTPLDKVSDLAENIKLMLNKHDDVIKENIRVYFDTISSDGIILNISFYTTILNYNEFLKFKEEMNYRVLDMVQEKKINLAYPSQSIYLKKEQ